MAARRSCVRQGTHSRVSETLAPKAPRRSTAWQQKSVTASGLASGHEGELGELGELGTRANLVSYGMRRGG